MPGREPMPLIVSSDAPAKPRAVLLLLHGGSELSRARVGPNRPAWRQVLRLARGIEEELTTAGVVVAAVRNTYVGWNNNDDPDPVRDALAALEVVQQRHRPQLPVVLGGHSLGGRTAVRAAADPSVTGVIGLAAWLPAEESVATLVGKHLRLAHAQLDHNRDCAGRSTD